MNNNKNRFLAFGKHMNNTTDKTEERSFQEERRDVMKMDKMFAGLIALVAGVALSAGSAFATNGYVGGDFARMKLIPYYETGDTKATIIGIQNLSGQEQDTMDKNADVTDIQAVLNGRAANANAAGLITGIDANGSLCSTTAACTTGQAQDPTKKANTEAALEKAKMAAHTEHLFIMVNVYDSMGMMMDDASATLCLKEHEFGVVVLQGAMNDMMMDSNNMKVMSVMDEDIPAYGYVKVMAEDRKFTGCGATAPNRLQTVDTRADTSTGDKTENGANSLISTWAIIQDTGMGFFGTEVPSATISMEKNAGADATITTDDGDPELACYSAANATDNTPAANELPNSLGAFMMTRCGLIPERHNITADADADGSSLDEVTTTNNANAIARYDIGDESTVYVWLAKGDDAATKAIPSKRRMLDVTVKCEDGMVMMDEDVDGNKKPFRVAAPGMLTMINPSMGDLGMATDMCEGDRGVLKITMPNGSHAGAVLTHITQMEGHYRMNFPGYSMASMTDVCTADSANKCQGMD